MNFGICPIIEKCKKEKEKTPPKNPCAASTCPAKSYKGGCVPHCGLGKSNEYCKAVCVVCNRKKVNANPIYTEQLKSGYMGHVPMSSFQLGLSFPEAGIIGIAQFEAARSTKMKCKQKMNKSANNSNSSDISANNSNRSDISTNNLNRSDISTNNSNSSDISSTDIDLSYNNINQNNDNALWIAQNSMINFNFKKRNLNGMRCWRTNLINIPETAGIEVDKSKQEDGVRCVICPCPVPVPMPDVEETKCCPDLSKFGTPNTYTGPCLKGCGGLYCPIPYEQLSADCDRNNSNARCTKLTNKCSYNKVISQAATNGSPKNLTNNGDSNMPINISAFPNPSPCCQYPCMQDSASNPACYSSKCCRIVSKPFRPSMKNYECCPTPPPKPLFMYYTEKEEGIKCESESPTCPPNCCFMPCGLTKECCMPCCSFPPSCCEPSCCCSSCCCNNCCEETINNSNSTNKKTCGVDSKTNNMFENENEEEKTETNFCDCDAHTCVPTPAFVPENVVCYCPCMPERPNQLLLTRNPPKTIPVNCCSCCKAAVPFNAALYPRIANRAIQNWSNVQQRTIGFELAGNSKYILPEDLNKFVDASLIY